MHKLQIIDLLVLVFTLVVIDMCAKFRKNLELKLEFITSTNKYLDFPGDL